MRNLKMMMLQIQCFPDLNDIHMVQITFNYKSKVIKRRMTKTTIMKNIICPLLYLIFMVSIQSCHSSMPLADNVICQLIVESGNIDRNESVVSVPLDHITFVHDS